MEDEHSKNKAWLPSLKTLEAERQRKRLSLVRKSSGNMSRIPVSSATARRCTRSGGAGREVTHLTPDHSLSDEADELRDRMRKSRSLNVGRNDRSAPPEWHFKETRESVKLPHILESSRRTFEIRRLWLKAFNFITISIRYAKFTEKRREERMKRSVKTKKIISEAVLSHKIRNRWKRAVHILRIAFRINKSMAIRSLEVELVSKAFTDYAYQEDLFDTKIQPSEKNVGNKRKEANLSMKAQAIMLLPPSERTVEDCSVVLYNLQCIESFRLYPLDIQKNIVHCGYFLPLRSGRVLTRQGHVAQNWYFVVSGQGLVRETVQRGGPCKTTVDILTKGMTFGESDLEEGARRKYTVMSRNSLNLIFLSKADYLWVFAKRLNTHTFNDHLDFIRNIHFMKYWPMEHLLNRSFLCYQGYFKFNDVVVENSQEANTICIIRSGRCVLYIHVEATTASWKDIQLTDAPLKNTYWWTEFTNNKRKKGTRNEKEKEIKQSDTKQIKKETKVDKEEKATKDMGMEQKSTWPVKKMSSKLPRDLYTVNSKPVYIEIQTLSAGDVFGLDNLKLPGISEETCDTKLCLVSLGAEVILLSKSFYTAHWNARCQYQVLMNRPSYPKMEDVKTQYRRHLAWELYTKKMRDELFEDLSNQGLNNLGIFFDTRYITSSL